MQKAPNLDNEQATIVSFVINKNHPLILHILYFKDFWELFLMEYFTLRHRIMY